MADSNLIKELRDMTGAGIMDVKEALTEAGDDKEKALEFLRKKGIAKMSKKADRVANEGVVESYIHVGGRVGVLVEVNCETDFVARTDDFKALAKDIALHIAGANPLYIAREDVPAEVTEKEREIYKEQVSGKPEDVMQKIMDGKLEKYYEEVCLMEQPFIKDGDRKVGQLISDATAKMGEKVQISRFSRFVLGN